MPLVLVNAEDNPTYPAQAILDRTDLLAVSQPGSGYGVLSGCAASAPGGMNVAIAAGVILAGNAIQQVTATTVPIAASGSFDRRDLIVASSGGALSAIQGTPCTTANWTTYPPAPPVKPTCPTGSIPICEVMVPASVSAITTAMLTDKTLIVSCPVGLELGRATTAVTQSLSGASNTAYPGLSVPVYVPSGVNVTVTAFLPFVQKDATGSYMELIINDSNDTVSNQPLQTSVTNFVASTFNIMFVSYTYTPAVGAHTYWVGYLFGAGGGTSTAQAHASGVAGITPSLTVVTC